MHYLFSHNDLDGVGCGILARLAYTKEVKVEFVSVHRLDQKVEQYLESANENDYLFITDLSINHDNEERILHFLEKGGDVRLIDHHKTALHLSEHAWATIQVTEEGEDRLTCATSLFYKYLVDNNHLKRTEALDEFVELVRQWDTWEWDLNNNLQAKRLNDLFFLLSIDEFIERMIPRLESEDGFNFEPFEDKILDMEEEKINRYIKRKRRELVQTTLHKHYVGIVHAEAYHSELGNRLGKDCPHLDYIAIINVGQKKMSFRTIHDHTDVSIIAEQYEGGGHAKAAGASLTPEAFEQFVKEPFTLEPLHLDASLNKHNIKESGNGTLYRATNGTLFFLYPNNEKWIIERNNKHYKTFATFSECEHYIKRQYQAWLVRDESYITFLAQTALSTKR
ncbi:DHH family phosphoesterase [Bacillus sp. JCM 19034]|uniref:DHH family phosphoesterase n=1 Tax=Bacillus sp. JCM 19034 TaxID=1481928 RepID=UPI000780AF89|nr:DHH family phosphoesterase [Bacillus sp. JCM 19034]